MANVDSVDMTGRAARADTAPPHTTIDPIVLAAEIVLDLQTIVSRETQPGRSGVVTVGSIHGGTKHNIIPDEVQLQLTVRSFSDEVQHILAAVDRIARGQALAADIPEDRMPIVQLEDEFTPALDNTPELTHRLVTALKPWLGPENIRPQKPVMGGEDFGEYGRTADKIPVTLLALGAVDPDRVKASERTGQALPSLHSSHFLPVPEPTIKTGVKVLTASVFELAGKK